MRLNTMYNLPGIKKTRKRVGRGIGSGCGKTCGKGVKGQLARSGVAIKSFEGGQTPLIKILPKRGFKSRAQKYIALNIKVLAELIHKSKISSGSIVNKDLLLSLNLISDNKKKVKLLWGNFDYNNESMALEFNLDYYSSSTRDNLVNLGYKIN